MLGNRVATSNELPTTGYAYPFLGEDTAPSYSNSRARLSKGRKDDARTSNVGKLKTDEGEEYFTNQTTDETYGTSEIRGFKPCDEGEGKNYYYHTRTEETRGSPEGYPR